MPSSTPHHAADSVATPDTASSLATSKKHGLMTNLVSAMTSALRKQHRKRSSGDFPAPDSSILLSPAAENASPAPTPKSMDIMAEHVPDHRPNGPRMPVDPEVAADVDSSIMASVTSHPSVVKPPVIITDKSTSPALSQQEEQEVAFVTQDVADSVIVDLSRTPISDGFGTDIQVALSHSCFANDLKSVSEALSPAMESEMKEIPQRTDSKIPPPSASEDKTASPSELSSTASDVVPVVAEAAVESARLVADNSEEGKDIADKGKAIATTTEETIATMAPKATTALKLDAHEFDWSDSVPEELSSASTPLSAEKTPAVTPSPSAPVVATPAATATTTTTSTTTSISTPAVSTPATTSAVVAAPIQPPQPVRYVESAAPATNVWAVRSQKKPSAVAIVTPATSASSSPEKATATTEGKATSQKQQEVTPAVVAKTTEPEVQEADSSKTVGSRVVIPKQSQANVKPGISYAGAAGSVSSGSSAAPAKPSTGVKDLMETVKEAQKAAEAAASTPATGSNNKKKTKRKVNKKKTAGNTTTATSTSNASTKEVKETVKPVVDTVKPVVDTETKATTTTVPVVNAPVAVASSIPVANEAPMVETSAPIAVETVVTKEEVAPIPTAMDVSTPTSAKTTASIAPSSSSSDLKYSSISSVPEFIPSSECYVPEAIVQNTDLNVFASEFVPEISFGYAQTPEISRVSSGLGDMAGIPSSINSIKSVDSKDSSKMTSTNSSQRKSDNGMDKPTKSNSSRKPRQSTDNNNSNNKTEVSSVASSEKGNRRPGNKNNGTKSRNSGPQTPTLGDFLKLEEQKIVNNSKKTSL